MERIKGGVLGGTSVHDIVQRGAGKRQLDRAMGREQMRTAAASDKSGVRHTDAEGIAMIGEVFASFYEELYKDAAAKSAEAMGTSSAF